MEHGSEDAPLAADSRMGSEEVLVEPTGTGAPGVSNTYALKIAGITTLVCLLVSAQAFTAYMVFSQRQQIQGLQTANQRLRSQMAQPTRVAQPVKLSSVSMPFLDFLDDEKSLNPTTPKAEPKMEQSKEPTPPSVEEELRDFMKDIELPRFNQSFLANLQTLKEQIGETSWKSFESWLRHWLLFQMAQKAPTPRPASGPMTQCQIEASTNGLDSGLLGSFRPQCDEQGKYRSMQCWPATGYCWCVDESGTHIEGTKVHGRPDCDRVQRVSPNSNGPVMMSGLSDFSEDKSDE